MSARNWPTDQWNGTKREAAVSAPTSFLLQPLQRVLPKDLRDRLGSDYWRFYLLPVPAISETVARRVVGRIRNQGTGDTMNSALRVGKWSNLHADFSLHEGSFQRSVKAKQGTVCMGVLTRVDVIGPRDDIIDYVSVTAVRSYSRSGTCSMLFSTW